MLVLKKIENFFIIILKKLFPDTEYSDYKNGVYSIDSSSREQWESIEDFPPYEINVENGEELFNTPFKMATPMLHVLKMMALGLDKIVHFLMKIPIK